MPNYESRKKLQDIIGGTCAERTENNCATVRNLLIQSFGTGRTAKGGFESKAILKKEQAKFLKTYSTGHNLWLPLLPKGSEYLTKGGEAIIYLAPDKKHVIKVNNGIYDATWTEYYNSLIIHNLLFPNTTYDLLGFTANEESNISAVVKQPFIEGGQAGLDQIIRIN